MATYKLRYRTLSGGLIGVILTGFRDGRAVALTHVAAVKRDALVQTIAEIVIGMAARGVEVEA